MATFHNDLLVGDNIPLDTSINIIFVPELNGDGVLYTPLESINIPTISHSTIALVVLNVLKNSIESTIFVFFRNPAVSIILIFLLKYLIYE